MSAKSMLVYHVSQIPPEGIELDAPLDAATLRVEGEDSFELRGGHIDGRLEKGEEESVHLRGHLVARVGAQCGRCLEGYDLSVDQQLDLFYLPHREDAGVEEEDEVELSDREVVVGYYRADRLDVGESLREQLILGMPMSRVCGEGCRGLCPSCGQNLNQGRCACPQPPEGADPRLAVLGELFNKNRSGS